MAFQIVKIIAPKMQIAINLILMAMDVVMFATIVLLYPTLVNKIQIMTWLEMLAIVALIETRMVYKTAKIIALKYLIQIN